MGEIVWDVIPEGLSGGCQPQKNQTPAGSGASKCHRQGKSVTDAAASLLSISSTAPNAHINNMVDQDAVVLIGAHQCERRAASQIHDQFPGWTEAFYVWHPGANPTGNPSILESRPAKHARGITPT